jgi:hypothetical protein
LSPRKEKNEAFLWRVGSLSLRKDVEKKQKCDPIFLSL